MLRAYNKEMGPQRITLCSYGFLRTEPYEPKFYGAHEGARYVTDKVDGERYVKDTIDWLIKKGELLEYRKEESIKVKHTFKHYRKTFPCREELYISDEFRESHYKKSNEKNKGKLSQSESEIFTACSY